MYYVYLIKCQDNTLYCGISSNPERRLREHLSGKGAWYFKFKKHAIREMRIIEYFETQQDAMKAERDIKKQKRQYKESIFQASNTLVKMPESYLTSFG